MTGPLTPSRESNYSSDIPPAMEDKNTTLKTTPHTSLAGDTDRRNSQQKSNAACGPLMKNKFMVRDTRRLSSSSLASNSQVVLSDTKKRVIAYRSDIPGDFFIDQVAKVNYDQKLKVHLRNVQDYESTVATGDLHMKFLLALLGEVYSRLEGEKRKTTSFSGEDPLSGAPLKLLRNHRSSSEKLKKLKCISVAKRDLLHCAEIVQQEYRQAHQEESLPERDCGKTTTSLLDEPAPTQILEDPYPNLSRFIASYHFFEI